MTNLIKRSLTGVLFVSIIVLSSMASWWTWGIVLIFLLVGFNAELSTLLFKIGHQFHKTIIFLSSFLIFGGSCYFFLTGKFHILPIILLSIGLTLPLFYSLFTHKKITLGAMLSITSAYISLPLSMSFVLLWTNNRPPFSYKFQLFPDNYFPTLLLGIFILIWTYDSFAYLVGSLIGKHKMVPEISPKKSWEGFFGGILFGIMASFILSRIFTCLNFAEWTGLAIIVAVFGTLGDLFESQFKRMAKVKDSGNILPGHGGLLDRFDSFLMIIPFALIYFMTLSYV